MWHPSHDARFIVFAGSWAVYECENCGLDSLNAFWKRWRRCRGTRTSARTTRPIDDQHGYRDSTFRPTLFVSWSDVIRIVG